LALLLRVAIVCFSISIKPKSYCNGTTITTIAAATATAGTTATTNAS
jgi:hypothetical protein